MGMGRASSDEHSAGSGAFVTRRFHVSWADGVIVSRFWGAFDQPPEHYALELAQLHGGLLEAMAHVDGEFVSLVDARSVGEVHPEFGATMERMFQRLPRAPSRRAFLVGTGRASRLQTAIMRAATLGRVRVFVGAEADAAPGWLAESGLVSEAVIRSLWHDRPDMLDG